MNNVNLEEKIVNTKSEIKKLLEISKSSSIFLNGDFGTGKTYMIKEVLKEINKTNEKTLNINFNEEYNNYNWFEFLFFKVNNNHFKINKIVLLISVIITLISNIVLNNFDFIKTVVGNENDRCNYIYSTALIFFLISLGLIIYNFGKIIPLLFIKKHNIQEQTIYDKLIDKELKNYEIIILDDFDRVNKEEMHQQMKLISFLFNKYIGQPDETINNDTVKKKMIILGSWDKLNYEIKQQMDKYIYQIIDMPNVNFFEKYIEDINDYIDKKIDEFEIEIKFDEFEDEITYDKDKNEPSFDKVKKEKLESIKFIKPDLKEIYNKEIEQVNNLSFNLIARDYVKSLDIAKKLIDDIFHHFSEIYKTPTEIGVGIRENVNNPDYSPWYLVYNGEVNLFNSLLTYIDYFSIIETVANDRLTNSLYEQQKKNKILLNKILNKDKQIEDEEINKEVESTLNKCERGLDIDRIKKVINSDIDFKEIMRLCLLNDKVPSYIYYDFSKKFPTGVKDIIDDVIRVNSKTNEEYVLTTLYYKHLELVLKCDAGKIKSFWVKFFECNRNKSLETMIENQEIIRTSNYIFLNLIINASDEFINENKNIIDEIIKEKNGTISEPKERNLYEECKRKVKGITQ